MASISRRFPPLVVSAFALAALMTAPARAQAAAEAAPAGPAYAMAETETFELVADDGYPYQIFVSKPKGEAPPNGYPLLYVLDGNAMFAGFAETRRIMAFTNTDAGKSIVVGIGYKTDKAYDTIRRRYDFTQALQKPPRMTQEPLEQIKTGGREKFASFILDKLRPELARRYKLNPERQALFGHSLGGLFSLYMFYSHPTDFRAIIAASPSIWWNDQSLLAEERAFTARLTQGKITGQVSRVRVVAGALEETRAVATDAIALGKRLEPLSAYGLRSEFELFEGEGHITVPSRSITSTLRFAFIWP